MAQRNEKLKNKLFQTTITMPPKLKTKKAKADFKTGLTCILESHHLFLEPEVLDPLLSNLEVYFNDVYKPDDTTPHFPQLVGQYMNKFEEVAEGEKFIMNPIHAINLKRLSKVLQKRYIDKNPTGIWDLNSCLTQFAMYYEAILTIPFMRQNFTPTMMYSRHNENITYLAERKKMAAKEKENILGI